ncbi:MAG: UDP-N-acetylenolpyruvoylglucosamine reductase [Pelagibacteraceae bacterium TMED65]|nr:UDP-N-acetylenolpyruvoylglucosamine reductase [Rickettsiales bacterium]OUU51056.1 MAG: UDP-N-acetylenolpyruvoylglucosamine reductase [Pelagibacteraceae bacterium TMED65]
MLNKLFHLSSVKFNYELGKKTWFGSGGNCKIFYNVDTVDQLKCILKTYRKFFPILVIGGGSNLLIRDGGFSGVVIKLGKSFKEIKVSNKNSILSVGAAVKDLEVSRFCLINNISGFEFLSGIPGTIGGNLKMNAGCFGAQISDNLIDCTIVDKQLNLKILKKNEIDFSYRKSSFSSQHIIIEARFKINQGDKKLIKKKINEISNKRKKTQPIASRTGGSTFTNPPKHSAWKLIDAIKYRGKKIGGAKVSEVHSNFLINENLASSLDIELLGEEIKNKVWNQFEVELNWELLRVGKFKKI